MVSLIGILAPIMVNRELLVRGRLGLAALETTSLKYP